MSTSFDDVEEALRKAIPIGLGLSAAKKSLEVFLTSSRFTLLGLQQEYDYANGEMWNLDTSRGDLRRLHGFLLPTAWIGVLLRNPDSLSSMDDFKSKYLELVENWHGRFKQGQQNVSLMAYHDETTAQRVLGLVGAVRWLWNNNAPPRILERIEEDVALLRSESFYAGLNNHGMFQNIAILAWAANSTQINQDTISAVELAHQRLEEYAEAAFTSEGVHIEHSPSYHLMVAREFNASLMLMKVLQKKNALRSPAYNLERIFSASEKYATHMVLPTGLYPRFSDTTVQKLDTADNFAAYGSPEFKYAVTGGRSGVRPEAKQAIFGESGYAIYRSAWGDPNSSYMLFTAAYNGNYHKHSDELSIILFAKGHETLTEAGPNGYDYKNSLTKYAYSSWGHNTLIVDGKGLPRTDGKFKQTEMFDLSGSSGAFDVLGRTTRYQDVTFERRIKIDKKPDLAETFTIDDSVVSPKSRDYQLLWHFNHDVDVRVEGLNLVISKGNEELAVFKFESSSPLELIVTPKTSKKATINSIFPRIGQVVRGTTISLRTQASRWLLNTSITVPSAE